MRKLKLSEHHFHADGTAKVRYATHAEAQAAKARGWKVARCEFCSGFHLAPSGWR